MEKEIIKENIQQEGKLKMLYNNIASGQEQELMQAFFDAAHGERRQKMHNMLQRWKKNDDASFNKLWSNFKKDILM
jgi:hypothetical protein